MSTNETPSYNEETHRWMIQNLEGQQDLRITPRTAQDNVYISNCRNCVVQVLGDVQDLVVENCAHHGMAINGTSSSFTIYESQSVKVQLNQSISMIELRKTEDVTLFVNPQSKDIPIYTWCCSETNIELTSDDGDLYEFPLPEQLLTVFKDHRYVTQIADLNL